MKVFTGKELFDSFVGLNESMTKLKQMADSRFHITVRYKGHEFTANDEPDIAIKQFAEWLETFSASAVDAGTD